MEIASFVPGRRTGTRILATLGPASSDRRTVSALAEAGASGFRLNFTHGEHDVLAETVATVRGVARDLKRPLALVGDLSGPKLRTGPLAQGIVKLEAGTEVWLDPALERTEPGRIAVPAAILGPHLREGTRLLLDDGAIDLRVIAVEDGAIRAAVIYGNPLGSHKGINIPGVRLPIPAITPKDERDLAFALEHDLDFIALSFVRDGADVVDLKRRIAQAGRDTPVIAKIEKPLAVANLPGILEVSDAIMVARGDLGVELGPERVPVVQKRIINDARRAGKLVITATQMLESMTHNASPTRAEASDVANAIFDGTDVIMLSGETAIGEYPVKTVETMTRIARFAEGSDVYRDAMARFRTHGDVEGVASATVAAACVAADQLKAKALIPFTSSGWTAFNLASRRPETPIYACTSEERTCARLALCWGAEAVLVPAARDLDDLYVVGIRALITRGLLGAEDVVVLLSGSVISGTGANSIKLYRVGTLDLTDHPETRHRLQGLVDRPRTRP